MASVDEKFEKIFELVSIQTGQLPYNFLKKILIKHIEDYKGKGLLGIFYKFNTIITTKNGDVNSEKLVEVLAKNFAKNDFVVIAGDFIYEKEDGKIISESTTLETIRKIFEKNSEDDSHSKLSDFLSSLTSYAVFLLLDRHSASIFEEINFHDEESRPNKGSVAIGFTDNFPSEICKFLIKKEIEAGFSYHLCTSTNFLKECKREMKKCFFTQTLGLSATPLQLHINKRYSNLILVDQYQYLHEIVLNLIKENR